MSHFFNSMRELLRPNFKALVADDYTPGAILSDHLLEHTWVRFAKLSARTDCNDDTCAG